LSLHLLQASHSDGCIFSFSGDDFFLMLTNLYILKNKMLIKAIPTMGGLIKSDVFLFFAKWYYI